MQKTILFLLGLLMVAACENKAYDTENLTTEVTLLEDEISVPLGNFGPFNLELVKQIPLVNQFLGTVMKTEADGTLLCETSEELYKIGIYEIMAKTKEDMSKPFSYPIGEKYTSPSTLSSMFQGFGFRSVDQHVTLSVNNPLDGPYTLGGNAYVTCKNTRIYDTCYEESFPLKDVPVSLSSTEVKLVDKVLPDSVYFTPSEMGFKDLSIDLPANPAEHIRYSRKTEFVFTASYKGHIAAGENAELPLAMFGMTSISVKFNLPIEAYDFKEVEVSLELQNTLPLQVEITNLQLLSGEKQDVDENLVATPANLIIKGGSLDNPGETPITLNIKALEGTIPNITGVKMGLAIKSAPGFADTLLSLKQGVSIKSATATLRSGVTLGVANE